MTNEEIKQYLREPATMQQRINALAVHSLGDIQAERKAEEVSSVRAEFGLLDIPTGSGHVLTNQR